MITTVKRIAVAGAISGALSLAALGLGAGTASADDSDIPFVPANPSDWQSYLPLVERLGDVINVANIGDLTGGTGGLGNLNQGQLENLLATLG